MTTGLLFDSYPDTYVMQAKGQLDLLYVIVVVADNAATEWPKFIA